MGEVDRVVGLEQLALAGRAPLDPPVDLRADPGGRPAEAGERPDAGPVEALRARGVVDDASDAHCGRRALAARPRIESFAFAQVGGERPPFGGERLERRTVGRGQDLHERRPDPVNRRPPPPGRQPPRGRARGASRSRGWAAGARRSAASASNAARSAAGKSSTSDGWIPSIAAARHPPANSASASSGRAGPGHGRTNPARSPSIGFSWPGSSGPCWTDAEPVDAPHAISSSRNSDGFFGVLLSPYQNAPLTLSVLRARVSAT